MPMKKRGGKRIQIKWLRLQIKQAIASYQNSLPFLVKLKKLEPNTQINKNEEPSRYQLIPVDFEIDYSNYDNVDKSDPRYTVYKERYLFGID